MVQRTGTCHSKCIVSLSTAATTAVTYIAHVEFTERHHGQPVPAAMLTEPIEDRSPIGLGSTEVEDSHCIVKVRRAPGEELEPGCPQEPYDGGRMLVGVVTGCSFLRRSGRGHNLSGLQGQRVSGEFPLCCASA